MSQEALGVRYGEGLHKRLELSIMIFNLIIKDSIGKQAEKGKSLKEIADTLSYLDVADRGFVMMVSELGGVYLSSAPLMNTSILYLSVASRVLEKSVEEGVDLEQVYERLDKASKILASTLVRLVEKGFRLSVSTLAKEAQGRRLYIYGSEFFSRVAYQEASSQGADAVLIAASPWDALISRLAEELEAPLVYYPNVNLEFATSGGREFYVAVEAESILEDRLLALAGTRAIASLARMWGGTTGAVSTPLGPSLWTPEFMRSLRTGEIVPSYIMVTEWGESLTFKALDPIPRSGVDALYVGESKFPPDTDNITLSSESSRLVREALEEVQIEIG
ncbi:hypothetical protein [Aeropyrum pernix]|nr:hypothetical protein [Aeropyrum pernix]